jgi:hypothetical protein
MQELPQIDILQGFSGLSFGADPAGAILVFGEPEETQTLRGDILGDHSLVYHYRDRGFALFFDLNKNNTFCSVEIDNRETLLFGIKIFTLREKELIALLYENGHPLSDTEMHPWGEKRLSFDTAGLDCYFENNRLVSLNYGLPDTDPGFVYFPN